LPQVEDGQVKLRAGQLVWRQVGDEVVALDTARSQYLSVNKTGALLWPMLMEGSTRPDLVRALVERYGLDEETAAKDTADFLTALGGLDVLET
jgi:Coenzyme PQQ synthesis protein D (PqqD)